MNEHETLSIDDFDGDILNAIDNASDQGRPTWLTDGSGKRLAAIVPVDVLEAADRQLAEVMATAVGSGFLDAIRANGPTSDCSLCAHQGVAHRNPFNGKGEYDEMDCLMCPGGKCRTPAGARAHQAEVAARSGAMSRRWR